MVASLLFCRETMRYFNSALKSDCLNGSLFGFNFCSFLLSLKNLNFSGKLTIKSLYVRLCRIRFEAISGFCRLVVFCEGGKYGRR